MKNKKSKAEKVKFVRQILAKFSIDISQLHLGVHSNCIDMSGVLKKYNGDDFTAAELRGFVDALAEFGHITTSLSNWDLTNGEVRKLEK
ncbi:MAG: hypothetical protein CME64_00980 [Halobacteriovoraceae bacterium]|nr:hypothetical protein [Halobacteriovoraceae bacterium]|tara:strand:- start:216127 stop:216393 length:267 start_codon:yes stop_codon:yes gene_type:complete